MTAARPTVKRVAAKKPSNLKITPTRAKVELVSNDYDDNPTIGELKAFLEAVFENGAKDTDEVYIDTYDGLRWPADA